MQVIQTALPGVLLLEPRVFGDERGFFFESFNEKLFTQAVGAPVAFVQDNHARSRRGVLRGPNAASPGTTRPLASTGRTTESPRCLPRMR